MEDLQTAIVFNQYLGLRVHDLDLTYLLDQNDIVEHGVGFAGKAGYNCNVNPTSFSFKIYSFNCFDRLFEYDTNNPEWAAVKL